MNKIRLFFQDNVNIQSLDNVFLGLSRLVLNIGNFFIVLAESIFSGFGVFIALSAFLIAEYLGVKAGIQTFETHDSIASIFAAALVIGLAIVKIITVRVEYDAQYDNRKFHKASLRMWWENIKYRLGYGSDEEPFEPISISPAYKFRAASKEAFIAIIIFSAIGRMWPNLETHSEVWYFAIIDILINGSAPETFPVVLAAFGTYVSVKMANILSEFVGYRAIDIRENYQETVNKQQIEYELNEPSKEKINNVKLTKTIEKVGEGYIVGNSNVVLKQDEESGLYLLKLKDVEGKVETHTYETLEELQELGVRARGIDLRGLKAKNVA